MSKKKGELIVVSDREAEHLERNPEVFDTFYGDKVAPSLR